MSSNCSQFDHGQFNETEHLDFKEFIEESDLRLRGQLYIMYKDVGSDLWITHFKQSNLIVNGASFVLSRLLGGGPQNIPLNTFKLGGSNNITEVETLLTPDPPDFYDTSLVYTDNLFTRNINDVPVQGTLQPFSITYPDESSLLVTVRIDGIEANLRNPDPTVYLAAGLFAGTRLFSSKTFPVITKIESRQILVRWMVRF